MKNQLLLFLFTSFLVIEVQSYELTPRNAAYCAYLSNKIFCYGGSPGDAHFDTSIHSLDINLPSGIPVNNFLNQWTNIAENASQIANEIRYDSEFVPLPDGVNMLFEGGLNDNNDSIANKTVTYNTQTDTWQALPNYNDPKNGGFRQIFAGSAVYLPNINCIGFYGGQELHAIQNSTYVTATGAVLPSSLTYSYPSAHNDTLMLTRSYVGFYYLTLLNLSNYAWSVPTQSNSFSVLVTYQTATFHPRTGKIYYLGGLYHNSGPNDILVPLSYSLTYDTVSSAWDNKTLNSTNGVTPSPRYLHTATLLTTTKEDIVVYGGTPTSLSGSPLPVMDYLYTLNLVTFSWTAHNPAAPAGVSGPRFYHSAVLVNDTSLFILLGKPKDQIATNDILVLDVRNPSTLVFSDIYPLASATASSNHLSKGAIAGIVIGVVVAVSMAIASGVFFCIRKKKRAAGTAANKEEELEVDWDRIEVEFSEVPPPISEIPKGSKSPTSTMIDTVTSSTHVPFSSMDSQKLRAPIYSPALTPDVALVKPDGADESFMRYVPNEKTDL